MWCCGQRFARNEMVEKMGQKEVRVGKFCVGHIHIHISTSVNMLYFAWAFFGIAPHGLGLFNWRCFFENLLAHIYIYMQYIYDYVYLMFIYTHVFKSINLCLYILILLQHRDVWLWCVRFSVGIHSTILDNLQALKNQHEPVSPSLTRFITACSYLLQKYSKTIPPRSLTARPWKVAKTQ